MTPPDWLVLHGGDLKLASDGSTWHVVLNQQPQYALWTTPVAGKFGFAIRQNNNGRRLECGGTYPTRDEALRGGLEGLREALGW
jgi:hypothetical protein